jgi:ankyrin repeat protein
MTEPRCPALLSITVLGLLLALPAHGQSYTTVPGKTLVSMMGVADPNAVNEWYQTALMAAASISDEKRVKDLIERKANVNAASKVGMTALMYANNIPIVKLLLGAGASVKDKDFSGKTALYYATQRADPEVVRTLIEAGADVNARDDKGRSALQLANLQLRYDNFSNQALRYAYRAKVHKVVDLLVASGAKAGHS